MKPMMLTKVARAAVNLTNYDREREREKVTSWFCAPNVSRVTNDEAVDMRPSA